MNVELAFQALEDAKAHPDNFSMFTWFNGENTGYNSEFVKGGQDFPLPCGTTARFAGFAALRAAPAGAKVQSGYLIVTDDDRATHVETYATKALEISGAQANVLFFLNGIGEVEAAVRYLADNPDASLRVLFPDYDDDAGDNL